MRLSTLFTSIVALSVVLFTISSLLTTSSDQVAVNIVAQAEAGLTSPSAVTSPAQCDAILARRRPLSTLPTSPPPWQLLLNDTTRRNATRLYVHVRAAQTRRLGNQLFNYASLFGIAWRNNRIPLWPDARTQLRSAFNLRIPIDRQNTIINVSVSVCVLLQASSQGPPVSAVVYPAAGRWAQHRSSGAVVTV